ncbi:MAG: serine hydrolase [Actinobacteria bacterium]|nr:serine hydrolase [Actinomycetota bacterium]
MTDSPTTDSNEPSRAEPVRPEPSRAEPHTPPPGPLVALPHPPAGVPWPTDRWPAGEVADGVDRARLSALVDELLADPDPAARPIGATLAFLVVQRGRLVLERYGERHAGELEVLAGIEGGAVTAATPLLSWSMAKSVLHAVIGVLVLDGLVDIDDPAPVPAWQGPDDPRNRITWRHLLQMRPGLQWLEEYFDVEPDRIPDVVAMLYGEPAADMAAFAASFPLDDEPGSPSAYRYSSGTTNILAACVQRVLDVDETGMRSLLTDRLFAPLGMRSAEPSFDAAGTFVASSYLHATAQDYARFGLLYLRDGVWEGRRLLPPGWVDAARTPVSWDERLWHSMHWWVWDDGRGTFAADGFEGQRILLVPSTDLVVVRLGKTLGDHGDVLDAHLEQILACFDGA